MTHQPANGDIDDIEWGWGWHRLVRAIFFFFLFCFVSLPRVWLSSQRFACMKCDCYTRRDDDSDEWSHFLLYMLVHCTTYYTIWPGPFCLFGQYQQTHTIPANQKPFRLSNHLRRYSSRMHLLWRCFACVQMVCSVCFSKMGLLFLVCKWFCLLFSAFSRFYGSHLNGRLEVWWMIWDEVEPESCLCISKWISVELLSPHICAEENVLFVCYENDGWHGKGYLLINSHQTFEKHDSILSVAPRWTKNFQYNIIESNYMCPLKINFIFVHQSSNKNHRKHRRQLKFLL